MLTKIMAAVGVLTLSCLVQISADEYRIDSQAEFDRLREQVFKPADAILFKRGVEFVGSFTPQGSGRSGKPITINAYGDSKERPKIHAKGKHQAALLLQNASFWEVNGIEVTNTNGTDDDQGDLFGIYVLADKSEGVFEHIYINDCYVHDVNGKVEGKRRGGIHVHIKKLKKSIFNDLRITGNRVERIGGVGIGNDSDCGDVTVGEKGTNEAQNLWTKVYVADNVVDHTGRNCIIARVSKDAVYERNILANSSRYSTGHSIFNFNTVGMCFQYNEAYGNVGDGGKDRGGFDADYNNVNTLIQYNYSHDNNWFCGIMKKPNHGVIIRHNISQNDREGIYFFGFEKDKQADNIHIYNNTHFVRKDLHVEVFPEGRTPLNILCEKNIFYFEGQGEWGKRSKGINTVFNDNLYVNIAPHPSDVRPQVGNPLFVNPGKAGVNIDLKTMAELAGYQKQKGSQFATYGATFPSWK